MNLKKSIPPQFVERAISFIASPTLIFSHFQLKSNRYSGRKFKANIKISIQQLSSKTSQLQNKYILSYIDFEFLDRLCRWSSNDKHLQCLCLIGVAYSFDYRRKYGSSCCFGQGRCCCLSLSNYHQSIFQVLLFRLSLSDS